jgi:hypothetical protein
MGFGDDLGVEILDAMQRYRRTLWSRIVSERIDAAPLALWWHDLFRQSGVHFAGSCSG